MNKFTSGLGDKARRFHTEVPQPMLIEDRLPIAPLRIPAKVVRRYKDGQEVGPGIGHNSRQGYIAPSREGKLSISGYYVADYRIQLATLAAREQVSQQSLLAEAMNLLFDARSNQGISHTISGTFDRDVVEMFNIRARKQGTSRQNLLEEAVEMVLRKYGDLPPETAPEEPEQADESADHAG